MINIYDLYDLSGIFKNIRMYPNYDLNHQILTKCVGVLSNKESIQEINQFRTALCTIQGLDMAIYFFAGVQNVYVYFSGFLKKKTIYRLLIKACEELMIAISEENIEKTTDLADCLHNLPISIVENNFSIPKSFWKSEVKFYRNKWNTTFLKEEEKDLK